MAADNDDFLDIQLESTSFPTDRLRIRALDGREAISELFSFEVQIVSLDPDGPAPTEMLGADVTLVFVLRGNEIRRIHGMIAQIDDHMSRLTDHRSYVAHIVPRAHRLTLIETQDLFIQMSVPDIIQKKLDLVGILGDSELRLQGEYPKRELVIQYQESDLAYLSRLTEHLGISYFFEQDGGADRIIFTDHPAGFRLNPTIEDIQFRPRGEERDVFELTSRHRVVPSVYVIRDWNYRTPMVDLTAEHELTEAYPGGIVEQGAHHKTPAEGKTLARIRSEERQAQQHYYVGKTDIAALTAGARNILVGHPEIDSLELLMVEVQHHARITVAGVSGSNDRPVYQNTFRATEARRAYRTPRRTPKPKMAGLYTGILEAGPGGSAQVAQMDSEGRYTVRFLFDTNPPGEQPGSRPVRMIQHHVGENYGTHFPLKPGVEVLIGFVNGDPDRPVIVGAVPNPLKPTPVTGKNPAVHRTRTGSGITVDFVDE